MINVTVDHALILTAGIGTRLRPLTYVRAKPAVPVAGTPFIRHVLAWLAHQGIQNVCLNLHYLPETITAVVGDGRDLGMNVRYLWEPKILGSAGGPRAALPLLGSGSFLIVHGDTLTNVNVHDLMTTHRQRQASVTLAVMPNPNPQRYGGVVTDHDGWVQRFVPAGDPTPSYHFVGVQMVEPAVFETLPIGEPASTIGGIYSTLASKHTRAIQVHMITEQFLDIGTPKDYLEVSLALAEDKESLLHGVGTKIGQDTQVIRTVLWDNVHVGARCSLDHCVVTDGVRVPDGSNFRNVIITGKTERRQEPFEQKIGNLLVTPLSHNDTEDSTKS